MIEAKLSIKNQIVIPKEAREALGMKAGDKLLLVVRGNGLVILQKPVSYRLAIRGLAIDTNAFIYQLQSHPRYALFTDQVFKWLEQSGQSHRRSP